MAVAGIDATARFFLLVQSILGVLAFFCLTVFYPQSINLFLTTFAAQNLIFLLTSVALFSVARSQATKTYSMFLLAVTGAYSTSSLYKLAEHLEIFSPLVSTLHQLHFEYFLGWFLWRFVSEFPTLESSRLERILNFTGRAASFIAASFFFFLGLFHLADSLSFTEIFSKPFEVDSRDWSATVLELLLQAWSFQMPIISAALVVVAVKWFRSKGNARRRASRFMMGLLFCFAPVMFQLSARSLFPSYDAFFQQSDALRTFIFGIGNTGIALMPIITYHATVSQNALSIRNLARNALRYFIARYSAAALALIPFGLLISYLVRSKEQTIQQLLSGPQAILLFGLGAAGVLLMRYRQSLLDAIDKRFFRDSYNARKVLTELADQVRGTRSLTELSNLVCQGVDLALHVERGFLLALDPTQGRFLDPFGEVRPLDSASKLATMLQGTREPLIVDFEDSKSPLGELPDGEKHWLVDAKLEMLSPMYALDGNLIGILALGRKKSDEPFSGEDQGLVKGVCSSTGLVIELLQLKERTPEPKVRRIARSTGEVEILDERQSGQVANECMTCLKVYPSKERVCPDCGSGLASTLVPYVLHGQYRFESRLGAGGMAVVYRATDLRLGREVAVKTLPRVSPEASMRLHREARTAATVTDPGLAAIYGIESWEGMPLLIQEYLQGGTLSAKLRNGETLSPTAMIEMGQVVAQALQKIHSAGILHRDLKPSNIGYTRDGVPKLLDFGVARIQYDLRQDSEVWADGPTADEAPVAEKSRILNTQSWMLGHTATGQLVGTAGYLSPEAVLGLRPDAGVDLWALSVVLWESLAGANLFTGSNFQQILERIRNVDVSDLREFEPSCPEPILDFFAVELHRDPSRRAESGRDMYDRLSRLKDELMS